MSSHSTRPHFDPIVIDEELKRFEEHVGVIGRGAQAAKALLWFKEYAKAGDALKIAIEPVAQSSPGVESIKSYIEAAARAFDDDILHLAIGMAVRDFEVAKTARTPKKRGTS